MGRGSMQFHKRDTRNSHFSQCINLPRKGRGLQSRVKWTGCEKRSSSWSLFRKGPPLSCWVLLSSCPPGTMLVERCPPPLPRNPPPPHVSPNCPPCAGATLTAWTPDRSIWRSDQGVCSPTCSTAGSLLEWAAELHATTWSPLTLC